MGAISTKGSTETVEGGIRTNCYYEYHSYRGWKLKKIIEPTEDAEPPAHKRNSNNRVETDWKSIDQSEVPPMVIEEAIGNICKRISRIEDKLASHREILEQLGQETEIE